MVDLELVFVSIAFHKTPDMRHLSRFKGWVFLTFRTPYFAIYGAGGVLERDVPIWSVFGLGLIGGCQYKDVVDRLAGDQAMDILRLFSHVSCHWINVEVPRPYAY